MTDNNTKINTPAVAKTAPRRPNEIGSIAVQGHLRIFDPKTQQVLVEKPA
jgi:hypothetical protein